MRAIAKVLAERIDRWKNSRFRIATRRVLAREAAVSLGSCEDAAIDELEARMWARIDARISVADTCVPVGAFDPPSRFALWRDKCFALLNARQAPSRSRLSAERDGGPLATFSPPSRFALWLNLGLAGAIAIAFTLYRSPSPSDGLKGTGDQVYAPVVEALRVAVADAEGHVTRHEQGMRVHAGDALLFEAEIRGLDAARGLFVDLTFTVDGGPEETVIKRFALKRERQPFADDKGYVAFKPARAGDYTFRLTAEGEPSNVREMRVHVEETP